jgi:hypothetical protein
MVVDGCGRQEGAERCGVHDEEERTEDQEPSLVERHRRMEWVLTDDRWMRQ